MFIRTLLGILLISTSIDAAIDCAQGWVKNGNSCYKFVVISLSVRGKTWENAENTCKSYGGHLTSVTSQSEQTFLFNSIKQYRNEHFWIGYNDQANESNFEWSDGSNSTFTYWNWGEPNDYKNEDCAEIPGSSGRWNDNACKKEYSYICKTAVGKPVPTQATMVPPTTLTPLYCDAGWNHYGTSCYKFSKVRRNWVDAKTDCHQSGGFLVKVKDADEQHYLSYMLKSVNSQGMWIGLSDRLVEGLYIWEGDNTLVNYTNWNNGEPNDHAGNEDCIGMYTKAMAGYWNDDYCDNQKEYICEKPNGQNLCPVNWVTFNDSCYQFNVHPSQSLTWQEARNSCLTVTGSDLVSIHSSNEQLFLVKQMKDLKSGNVWLGLNDITTEGTYVWSDRSSFDYKNWGRYEPGSGWIGSGYDCSQMIAYSQNGTWGTVPCRIKNPYICKMDRASKKCDSPFGLANYLVGDSQISASSSKDDKSQPSQARLYLQPKDGMTGAWCAAKNQKGEFLQIDLGLVRRITHIALQGKPKSSDFVKSFYVKYSNDGKGFSTLGQAGNKPYKIFTASANADDVKNLILGETISGRFIRIYPIDWSYNICLRTEVYGCEGQAASKKCGLGWEEGPDNVCYQFNTNPRKMWADARASCTSQGGDLLSIVTNNERAYIDNRMKVLASSVNSMWIGLNDRESSKLFSWSDQSPYILTRWDAGYPNDNNNSKSCVEILPSRLAWRDADCGAYKPFVCKFSLQASVGTPKYSRTANWISTTDFYWPLDGLVGNKILGTTSASVTGGVVKSSLLQNNKNSLQFAGYNAYIDAGSFQGQCISDAEACSYGVTVSLIVKFDSDAASWPSKTFLVDTINDDTFATSRGISLYVENGQLKVFLLTLRKSWTLSKTLRTGIWQHVVVTWSQSALILYLNGLESVKKSYGRFQTPHNTNKPLFRIGSRSSQQVKGSYYMRAVAVWNRQLTAAEIKTIYNAEFGNCKFGWKEFGQYCYQFNYDKKNWKDARLQCQKNGGELVSINSPVEQAHVSLESGEYGFATYAWIGFHDKSIESAWEWSDGSTPRFSNWYNLQPDNWLDIEDCGHTYSQYWALGRWNDITCNTAMPYICKARKAYVPTGGVTPTTVVKNKTICQATTSYISCPTHTVISTISANYGRKASKMCGQTISVTNCIFDVSSKVKSMCDGKSYCTLRPSDTLFGKDPCPTVPKYLDVSYYCNEGPDATPGCPAGWQRSPDGNVCYGLMLDKKNWFDARASCKKSGAELVSIHTGLESTVVTSLLVSSWDTGDVWIGLTDKGQRGVYSWSDNTMVDFTHWYSGEPNDRDVQGGCVRASLTIGSRDWMYWLDDDCQGTNLAYICKKYRDNYIPPTKAPLPTPTGPCPLGWNTYKSGCYKVFMQKRTWTSARDSCRSFAKTDLVSIHDLSENQYVKGLTNSSYDAWIGLNDRGTISGHVWSDYTPVQFTNWGPGQPDSQHGQLPCVTLKSVGGWYDDGCFATRPYICKMRRPLTATTPQPATPTPIVTTQAPGICDPGWIYWNQLCYHFSNESLSNQRSWMEARSLCQKSRADLVSLRDAAENKFVHSEVKKRYRKWGIWIGLNDLGTEGVYKWSDGSPVSFINYAPNEPNDWMGLEDCIEIRRYDGKWNDQGCGLKQPFICRKHNNSVIPPYTMVPPTPGPAVGKCKSGWVNFDKSCYKFVFSERQNWANAQSVCKMSINGSMVGNLVSINSVYEQAFLTTMIKYYKGVINNMNVWIGLNDLHTEGNFVWADNSVVNYVNWQKGKPSYNYYSDCVSMTNVKNSVGRWDVQACTNFHGYICEAAALPLGPTPVTPTPSADCPSNFMKFTDDCYMVSYDKLSWDAANQKCKSNSADLISIHNPIEQAYLVQQMVHFTGTMWIGLSRQNMAVGFLWSDQSIQEYTHWSRGQPGQAKKQKTCVQAQSSDGRWTEVDCGLKNAYMCKINKGEPHVTPALQGQCLTGWTKFEKHCYLFQSKQFLTWPQARLNCVRQGGDLVSVLNLEERDFLIYQLNDYTATSVWTGLNDRNTEGGYQWSDGSPSSFISWSNNEPNDPNGVENCVEMYSSSGQLNDLYCSQRRAYVCKSPLECSSALGMSDGSITDTQITVSSSIDNDHDASNARLNSTTAWCANASIPSNFLQVDLQSQTRISKISIQGTSSGVNLPSFVKSFTVAYGNYENKMTSYLRADGLVSVISANKDASMVVTAALNPPIDARYIRVAPVTWSNNICAKIELYGCPFECETPMGMSTGRIRDHQITASSSKDGEGVSEARPVNNGWCPASTDKSPWIQVNFPRIEKRISQITTWGSSSGYVTKYKLAYSDDGTTWTDYTEKGIVRIFRGNIDARSPIKHILGEPINTQNLRIKPLTGKVMCLRFEIFGCANGCLYPLGMEKGSIEDSWISASSNLDAYKPSMGRLNNPQGWCAATNDRDQFLTIDLNRGMRIRQIATQGSSEGYVTSFNVRFKRDDTPWKNMMKDGSIVTFPGNSDATTVVTSLFPKVIRARYVMVKALKWSNKICLRVELYGCLPYVVPTIAPTGNPATKPPEVIFQVSIRLTKVKWDDEYTKQSSSVYKSLASKVVSAVNNVYAISKYHSEASVTGFRRGSVIADLKLVFVGSSQSSGLIDPLKSAVKTGQLGDLVVDPDGFNVTVIDGGNSKAQSGGRSSGLSTGGKAAIAVVFVLIAVAAALAAGWYFLRKRNSKFIFKSQTFDNPIHFSSKAYDMES